MTGGYAGAPPLVVNDIETDGTETSTATTNARRLLVWPSLSTGVISLSNGSQ